ncbi:RloB family protein [Paracrocinitomix mangrovi]|uniref:RloB family protein n=1 Tax=Paracrocinitomix mangrovi TaxID=2862509 RepID=UPI001C8E4D12|nr:RloB family protein [Paracrocinitomix mangrovi]UKN03808.1 RloB family protein [Paracrocinitomix mangrovi]
MPKKTRHIKITDQSKPWLRKKSLTKYKIEELQPKDSILIVCEGQTEERYFKSFPVSNAQVQPVGVGCSHKSLVECAINMAEDEDYDQVWCVFDMDFKPGENGQFERFDNAINMTVSNGFNCAYSNDAFELWFVLHYEHIDQEYLRDFLFEKLSQFWDISYVREGKKWAFANDIYSRLERDERANQELAIDRAEKLFELNSDKPPHKQIPVTLVFELVKILNEYIE